MPFSITALICLIIFIVSVIALRQSSLFMSCAFNPHRTLKGEYYRLMTNAFIHGSFPHLLVNTFVLYSFGQISEIFLIMKYGKVGGTLMFLALFLMGNVVSCIPALLKHRNNPEYWSVGASGGVSSILFNVIMLRPLDSIYIFPFYFIPIPAILFGLLYIIYEIAMSRYGRDNVAHDAHVWGAISGIIFTIILFPEVITNITHKIENFFDR